MNQQGLHLDYPQTKITLPSELFDIELGQSHLSTLIPIVSENTQYDSIKNTRKQEDLTWFDQYDLRPHPGSANFIT